MSLLHRLLSLFLSSTIKSYGVQSISNVNISTKFVLIGTKHPGNVGAAARGMKTMGFSELILVAPHDDRVLGRKKCMEGASGAADVLKEAKVYYSLDEAFRDDEKTIICGTGMPVDMRLKRAPQKYAAPRRFFGELLDDKAVSFDDRGKDKEKNIQIAFLFGNERYGMTKEDMEYCDVMLGIPTNPNFGSLNLATAVQIIAYDWREAIGGFDTTEI